MHPHTPTRPLVAALALALLLPALPARAQCPIPLPAPQFKFIDSPTNLVTADLNGDGIADIIATQQGQTNAVVVLSAGAGSFHPPQYLPVGGYPNCIAVGDFDGMGGLDLAFGLANMSEIAFYSNDGAGNLTAMPSFPVPSPQRSIAAGDLNGDGLADLVYLGLSDKTVYIYENDGAGGFTLWGSAGFAYGPYSLTMGDQDGDGFDEVVVVEANASNPLYGPGSVYFYRNNGESAGVWQGISHVPAVTLTDPYPEHAVFAELGGAPGRELVVTCNGFASDLGFVNVLSNPAPNVFADVDSYLTGVRGPSSVVGDLNGDGFADIATISDINQDAVAILLNNGDGTFALPVHIDCPGNHLFLSIAMTDLNDDGTLDLVMGGLSGRTAVGLVNRGDGTFIAPGSVATGDGPNTIQVIDIEKDGNLDFVTTTNENGGTLCLHRGNGDGTFQPPEQFAGQAIWGANLVADLNNDSWPDLISCTAGIITPLINDTMGGFAPGTPTPAIPNLDTVRGIEAGDFNADGHPDLAVTFFATAFPWNRLQILLHDGVGSYTLGDVRNLGSNAGVLRAHDVDGDDDIDLIVLRPYIADGVTVLYNNGAGVFSTQTDFPSYSPVINNAGAVSMVTADLDGDGDIDIAIVNSFALSVSVLLNNGSGVYTTLPPIDIGVRLFGIDAADITGDGVVDLVVGINQGATIDQESMYGAVLLPGLGGGQFGEPVHFAASIGPWDVASGDVDNDGRPDVLVACLSADAVDILLNEGCATPAEPCPGDANADGTVDFNDITAILANWLSDYQPGTGPGDANTDGTVDFNDITSVLANWLAQCQ